MEGLLGYVAGDGVLHRMNPMAKLACSLLFALACFCTSNLAFLAAMLALACALAAASGMARQTLSLVRAVCAFSSVLAIVQLLTTPSGALLVQVPWGYIGTGSVLAAVTTMVRLCAAAIPLFLAFSVTRSDDMVNAAVKVAHVPYPYAFAFASAVRFIPVFLSDMKGVIEAQTARGVAFDEGGIVRKLRLIVPLAVPLLMSSVRRANTAAVAAETRGFDLRTRQSGYKQYPITLRDKAALAFAAALLACSIALALLV